jgi:RimJ/RimL family protein N-acetyltransferase
LTPSAESDLSGRAQAAEVDPFRTLRTGRLVLTPVNAADLPDLCRLKADPQVFAHMLGGVRDTVRCVEELADDVGFWGRHGVGIWAVREPDRIFHGVTGFMMRKDGLGIALRFALWPHSRGSGLAREAAGAALRFAHERAGLQRVVAVAREDNTASRIVLGGIGMRECGRFERDGDPMLIYESAPRWRTPRRVGGLRSGSVGK